MNVQPKLSPFDDCQMPRPEETPAHLERRLASLPSLPKGPRAFVTWPVEFEVEPWRP